MFRIKASVTGSTLTLTTGVSNGFRVLSGVVVPGTLTAGYTLYIGCQYNSVDARWDVLGTKQGN